VHKLTIAVFATSLAVFGLVAPGPRVTPASAATVPVNPKVVLIVGPVGGSTSSYRSDATTAAIEARKYTTNVITIFTPTATWAKVKPALVGASIVVYMGHGNGWPSPYPPFQTLTKDGLGLNPSAGTDNTTTKYYGESYIDDIRLAPNAVVILGHLCYSAGNSEQGKPEVSLSAAKQRVDNMAAGWIRAGARSVIAEPHTSGLWGGAAWYIRQLFTTHQTMDQIFRSSPRSNNHFLMFPSTRSPGYTAEMDPGQVDAPPYDRAMTGKPDLNSVDVTGARYASTDHDPSTFVVPGAASVKVDGAGLFADSSLTTPASPATLAFDTRVRIDGGPEWGTGAYAVHTLDGSASGYMAAPSLTPRDSQAPAVWTAETGTGAFSPNGDGSQDTFQVTGQFSEEVTWRVDFSAADGSPVYRTVTGTGATYDATWDGKHGGTPVVDGTYAFTVTAIDDWGNPEGTRTGDIVVDTVAPTLASALDPSPIPTFSPNGDGVGESVAFAFNTNESGAIMVSAADAGAHVVRTFPSATGAGAGSVTWAGDDDAGHFVADGTYDVALAPRDMAGNIGGAQIRQVVVYTALKSVKTSPTLFYPQDADALARTGTLSFVLTKAATVTWVIRDTSGRAVYTRYDHAALAAGTYTYAWNGKLPGGAYAPRGRYNSEVTATDGSATWSQHVYVYAQAFRINPATSTPALGQKFTVTIITAEPLTGTPKLTMKQSSWATVTLALTKVNSTSWRATATLHSTHAGSVVFKATGHDTHGGVNSATLTITAH
jgi:flagellar hook assembly protein FlgD